MIRYLTAEDAMIYKKLRIMSLQESPFAFSDSIDDESNKDKSQFEEELRIEGASPESFVLALLADTDELIGFLKFKRDLRTKARHKAFLHTLYVKKEFRGCGYGKKLIDELLKLVVSMNGLEQIHLWVLISDNSVVKFYEKCGFKSQGAVVKNDLKIEGRYVDAVYMTKYL